MSFYSLGSAPPTKIILFLCLITSCSFGQITILDSSAKKNLNNYDVFFMGEQHGYNKSEIIESKLIDLLYTKSTKVLMEGPYDRNFGFDQVYYEHDTSNYAFDLFNPSKTNLFRHLYYNRIPLKVIDVVLFKNWFKYEIEQVLTKSIKNKELKKDLATFGEIGLVTFPHKKKDRKNYFEFIQTYKKKKSLYNTDLGADSSRIEECFMAMEATILIQQKYRDKEKTLNAVREEFMFDRIAKEIKDVNNSRILSIQGWAHIVLENKLNLAQKAADWTPLAYRIHTSFPEKKICSIIIWNRNDMSGFPFFYPEDARYILKNTEPGKTYLIKVNYPGSPFKSTIGKFTHIIVF